MRGESDLAPRVVVGPTGFEPVTYRLMPKEIDVDTEKEGKFLGEMKIWGINNRTKRKPTVLLQVGCEDLSKKPFKVYIYINSKFGIKRISLNRRTITTQIMYPPSPDTQNICYIFHAIQKLQSLSDL